MKPVVRFTIGKVSKLGWTILTEGVRLIRKVYPEFDVAICHNNLLEDEARRLNDLSDLVICQDDLDKSFEVASCRPNTVRDFYWKLVPPRIRLDSHELWLDNDIIIRNRIKGIDDWLDGNTGIIGTGYNYDYGQFSPNHIDQPYCAGLFGLPPGYDFKAHILKTCSGKRIYQWDEQGVVAIAVTSFEDFIALPQNALILLSESWPWKGLIKFPNGLHFARANRFDNHLPWKAYKLAIMP